MQHFNLALLGFGNVGRALLQLLVTKRDELRDRHGFEWQVTGVASRRLGWKADPAGFEPADLLAGSFGGRVPTPTSDAADGLGQLSNWLSEARANVLFENTSLDPYTGRPAIDYLRTALSAGIHAVTANKGPVVHAYRELRDLAQQQGVRFLFEAAVMGGAPIFSLFREALPGANLHRFRGVLNSTTNLMLTEIERGASFDDAVHTAQQLGIAETDPSFDVDGWDAAVKVSALATVLMDAPLKPQAVEREGIRSLSPEAIRAARMLGQPYKLVCQAERHEDGTVTGSVRPERVPGDDPLAQASGATSLIQFQTDVLYGLTLSEQNPDALTTAYGPLADLITIARDANVRRLS